MAHAIEQIIKERLKKLAALRRKGVEPYPALTSRSHLAVDIRLGQRRVAVAGRIRGLRLQGGVMFLDVVDKSGRIQAVVSKNNLKNYQLWQNNLDIGDFVEVGGQAIKTKAGQLSVEAKSLKLIAKSLRPLPDQWAGLEDMETRLRKRYLDILMSPETRQIFEKKAVFWETAREFLRKEGFLEVETPALEAIPGGADAEPFVTHHNALDTDFYLRISLELPLKKLLVAGYEKVFEIGRIFRNEGIDKEHLQDYSQCEFYWAYADYNDLMKLVERMYKELVKKTIGSIFTSYDNVKINWSRKWPRVDYYTVFKKEVGLDLRTASDDDLHAEAKRRKLHPEKHHGRGRLIDLLFRKVARPTLIQPVFLIDPPVEIEPLAKRSPKDPSRVERFQIIAVGTELGKGFSEANDPQDQRQRFEEQMKLRQAGDKEAQRLDEDFLEALEYGMPPAAGYGFSERLFAVLLNRPVRETVIFPLLRPKKQISRPTTT